MTEPTLPVQTVFTIDLSQWKTTAAGVLSAAVMVMVAIEAMPPGQRKIAYAIAGARALLGVVQKDA